MPPVKSPSVLVVVFSAGIDPWLEIEKSGQERFICENARMIQDHIWISANPNFSYRARHRFLIGLAKLQMWHYPGAGKYFIVLRGLLVGLLKCFPVQLCMRRIFLNPSRTPLGALEGNRVKQNFPASTFLTGPRTLRAFEWALDSEEFDYLLRITSTCLINEPALMRFVEALPENRVYAGQELSSFGSNLFMSGAAFMLSRDVVKEIVAHQHKWRFDTYEDVALGRLINEFNIADFIQMDRLDLPSIRAAELVALHELGNAPVIRCKAEDVTNSSAPVLKIFEVVANRLGWVKV